MRILSGLYKNRQLKTPKGAKTRPTSSKTRGSVFDILQNRIDEAHFLDVFAGSGSMGIEALSRGAKSAVFIERDRLAAGCIRENLTNLGLTATVLQSDAESALKRLVKQKKQFDIIYIDPPYTLDIKPLLEKIPPLLAEGAVAILEQSKRTEIDFPLLELIEKRNIGDTTLYFWRQL